MLNMTWLHYDDLGVGTKTKKEKKQASSKNNK